MTWPRTMNGSVGPVGAGLGGSPALFDSVARIVRHEVAARPVAAVGTVTEAFAAGGAAADHAVTVQLRDTRQILPRVPIAVGVLGFAAIPAVGELVVVVFCDGDLHDPVVVGRLYHPGDDPPQHADGQVVLALPAGSPAPAVTITVTADPAVTVEFPDAEVKVALDASSVTVTVAGLTATLDGSGAGRIKLDSGASSLVLDGSGDATLTAGGTLKLEGAQVEVSGQGRVKVQGATVEIN
jgi:phage baseplate assembly protein gpV